MPSRLRSLSGGQYVNRRIAEALRGEYELDQINIKDFLERFSVNKFALAVMEFFFIPLISIYSSVVASRYDVVFSEWTPLSPMFGNLVYFQPFAGASSKLGLFYNPNLSSRSSKLAFARVRTALLWPLRVASLSRMRILCNSTYTAGLLRKELGREARVVYPPVDSEWRSPRPKEDLILTISRVAVEKNLQLLSRVGPSLSPFRFILIGKVYSEDGERILHGIKASFDERGFADLFEYLGFVEGQAKRDLLQRAKVLLNPAVNEPFGLSIVEGMGSGCIPVVHDSGGPRETVPSEWRFKTDEEAVEVLKRAVNSWNPTIANEMVRLSRKFSSAEFERNIIREAQLVSKAQHRETRSIDST